jgi:hypothetical protein
LMAEYQNEFILSPAFSTRIQSLSLEMPSLPYAIRILKRWLSSHMLLDVKRLGELRVRELDILLRFVRGHWEYDSDSADRVLI